jgi:hypothetical protein
MKFHNREGEHMKVRVSILATVPALLLSGSALAHYPTIEPQATHRVPLLAPPSEDYSFSSPRVLTNVIDSQAVFAYLTPGDVDFYKFTLAPADFARGPVIVSASALPPGCFQYQNVYPVTALIGPQAPSPFGPPGLPPATAEMQLPFEVPAGMGVIKANNPAVAYPGKRAVFQLEEADLGTISWFLPLGLTQECLLTNPSLCDFTNTIAQPVFYPGDYYLAIWNPTGIPTDYTANIGYSEANYTPADPATAALIRDNGLAHRGCSAPYPLR